MLKVVYPEIKAANPYAQVLIGGLLLDCDPDNPPENPADPGEKADCSPARFLEGILVNGGGEYFDGVSFHAYDYSGGRLGGYGNGSWGSAWNTTGPVLIAKARFIRELLTAYSHNDKFLLNTESAVLCAAPAEKCQSQDFLLTKAYYVTQSAASAAAEGLAANIWYSLVGWRNSGLIDAQREPEPAYYAFLFAAKKLNGVRLISEQKSLPGIMGYVFSDERNHPLYVLWSADGLPHSFQLPREPDAVYDFLGESIQPTINIQIGPAPVYIEL
jgi:hypothetical protein